MSALCRGCGHTVVRQSPIPQSSIFVFRTLRGQHFIGSVFAFVATPGLRLWRTQPFIGQVAERGGFGPLPMACAGELTAFAHFAATARETLARPR
jgi:hypothetical protein